MPTTQKHSIRFVRLAGKGVAFGALVLCVAGCVAESPQGHYGAYPDDAYYVPSGSTVVAPAGSTVVIHNDEPGYYEQAPAHDYDDHWEYGRRGNGNFHGEGDDDVHDD